MKLKKVLIFIIFFISEICATDACSQMIHLTEISAGVFGSAFMILCIANIYGFKKENNNGTDAEKAQIIAHNDSQFNKQFKPRICVGLLGVLSGMAFVTFGLLSFVNCL